MADNNYLHFKDNIFPTTQGTTFVNSFAFSSERVNRNVLDNPRDEVTGVKLDPKDIPLHEKERVPYKNKTQPIHAAYVGFTDRNIVCTFTWSNMDADMIESFETYEEFMESKFFKVMSYYFIDNDTKTEETRKEEERVIKSIRENAKVQRRYITSDAKKNKGVKQYHISKDGDMPLDYIGMVDTDYSEDEMQEIMDTAIIDTDHDGEPVRDFKTEEFLKRVSEIDNGILSTIITKTMKR